jgi:hypothetical protein
MKGTPTSQSSVSVVSLEELAEAIRQQTAAITRLADSNAALVAAMAEVDQVDEDGGQVPDTYLDGSRA